MKKCKGPEWAQGALHEIVVGINMSIFAARAIYKIVVGINMSIFAAKSCWPSTSQPLHILSVTTLKYSFWFSLFPYGSDRQPSSLFRFYSPIHKLLLTKPIRSVPFEPNFCYSPSRPIIEPTCCRLCCLPEYDHMWLSQREEKMMNGKNTCLYLNLLCTRAFNSWVREFQWNNVCVCCL